MKKKIILILLLVLTLSSLIALTVSALDVGFYVDINLTALYTYQLTTLRDGNNATVYSSFPATIVYDDIVTLKLKMKLDNDAIAQGYTGYFVTYIKDGINVIGNYTDLQPDQFHNYYIADDTYFIWSASASGGTVVFSPVNYIYFLDVNLGYTQGYNQGREEQYRLDESALTQLQYDVEYWKGQVISSDTINQQIEDAYNRGVQAGLKAAPEQKQFIQDVVTTGIDGFTDVVQQFLSLQILGIKVYQVVLLACLVPLFIFILKRVTHG